MTAQEVLAWIGGVAVSASALVGVAYWIFQRFGEAWLESRFAKQLEDLRHQQNQELEHLKFEISKVLDRSTKLHEKEFEVLPQAWHCLVDAYYQALGHTSSAKQLPAVDRMSPDELEEFLAGSQLTETQKQELRTSIEKDRTYYKLIYWHDKAHAEEVARTLSRYLAKHGIFLSNKEKFAAIETLIWDALLEYQLFRENEIIERQKVRRLEGEGKALMDGLEAEVHSELWSSDISARRPA
jgi:hypothetical protein